MTTYDPPYDPDALAPPGLERREHPRPPEPRRGPVMRFWHALGPGVITGAADDDPSGIATYSVARAQFGTAFLWVAIVTWPLMAAVHLFDLNRYANTTRLQFMNWGLFQNTAWDFAADTRGYTNGVAVAWVRPGTVLRVGSFQMPRRANGNVFDADLARARGDQAELTVTPTVLGLGDRTPTVRLLGYVNHARMGLYRQALAAAAATGGAPDVVATDAPGRRKRGWGVNAEVPLADGGETGLFFRAGGCDGDVESFAFTEVERHLSGGLQLTGTRWRRAADRVGLGLVRHGISADHRAYLAAGGAGFLLGDGRLRYGPETIGEAYYRAQIGPYFEASPDVQRVANPGYNRDRGPATVVGVRVNLRY